MQLLFRIILFITLIFSFSCEEQGLFVKCSDCSSDEPAKTILDIKVSENKNGGAVEINVYEGNLEDGILYKSFTTIGTHTTVNVTLNKKYTLTATYYSSGDTYMAVDSAIPKVKYTKDQCTDPCYFVYDKEVDLRLK